jgi:hypothetical protein
MTKVVPKDSDRQRNLFDGDDCLLTKSQLARRVNVSIRTVESWMSKKLIPYIKINKTVRFIWPDVEKALKGQFGVGAA